MALLCWLLFSFFIKKKLCIKVTVSPNLRLKESGWKPARWDVCCRGQPRAMRWVSGGAGGAVGVRMGSAHGRGGGCVHLRLLLKGTCGAAHARRLPMGGFGAIANFSFNPFLRKAKDPPQCPDTLGNESDSRARFLPTPPAKEHQLPPAPH